MAKQKAQANTKRKQKAAAKAKARDKKNRQTKHALKTSRREALKAKQNWPSEKEFSKDEHLFWIQHGVNYLLSDFEEGIWKPLFPTIYEGKLLPPEEIAQAIMTSTEGDDMINAMAWSAHSRRVVYTVRQQCIARLRSDRGSEAEDLSLDQLKERVRKPHAPSVWDVFDELGTSLTQKRVKRAEDQEKSDNLRCSTLTAETIKNATKMISEHRIQPSQPIRDVEAE